MAKDGTSRGGSRVGAGRKTRPLVDKVAEGKTGRTIIVLPEPPRKEGFEVPPHKEYMKGEQKNGKDLCAEDIYNETWQWLNARGCERLISPRW